MPKGKHPPKRYKYPTWRRLQNQKRKAKQEALTVTELTKEVEIVNIHAEG